MFIQYKYNNQSCTIRVPRNKGVDILAMFIANSNITIIKVEV